MQITLGISRDLLSVVLTNMSSIEMRFWEVSNSWGWWSISLQLRNEQDTNIYTIKRSQDVEFTKNGPGFFILVPGLSHEIPVNLHNRWWERDKALSWFKDKRLSIRANYSVGPSAEADQYGVFVGSTLSEWVVSEPPHKWLFTQSPDEDKTLEWLFQHHPKEVLTILSNRIESHVWGIELDARNINEDQIVSSTAPVNMNTGNTVKALVNRILGHTWEIREVIREVHAYLEANVPPETRDGIDTKSQD